MRLVDQLQQVLEINVIERFGRFGLVGLAQNAVSYLIILMLIGLGLAAWQAVSIVYPIAVAASFLGNRYWVFTDRKQSRATTFRYGLLYAVAYPVSMLLSYGLVLMGLSDWLAGLLTIVFLAVAVYSALNLWVFHR